jgi:hypothetical protein
MLKFSVLRRRREGYVFLISVLFIGAIASATTVSMLLLGLAAQMNGAAITESSQAWEYTQTCAERAIRLLREDPAFIGDKTFTFMYGTCRLLPIGGYGNEARTICSEGVSGDNTRRYELKLSKIFPSVVVDTAREVDAFTYCR